MRKNFIRSTFKFQNTLDILKADYKSKKKKKKKNYKQLLSYLFVFLNKNFEHQEAMLSLEAEYKIHLLFELPSVYAKKRNIHLIRHENKK